MKTLQLLVAGLLPVLLGARLTAAFNPSSPLYTRLAGTVVVPAEFRDHALIVEAMINGRGPFRMLIDTGSSVSLITPAVAEAVAARLPASEEPSPTAINGLGDETDVTGVLLDTLVLGTARFEGVPAGVTTDLATIARTDGQKLDGLLGFSLFSDVLVGLDFPGHRVVLSAGWPENLPPVRAEFDVKEQDEVPTISARLQGHDIFFLVDTGATAGLSLPPALAASVQWKAEPRPGALVRVIGETSRELVGRLSGEFHLGRVAQETPVASILDGAPAIGVEILQRFCVVFDESHDKMWLCAATDETVAVRPVRSVGLCLFADRDGWRVVGTIPGGPAEGAGISPGDVVTRIEGQPAREWSRDKLDGWVDTHPELALSVSHAAASRDVVLAAWSLVP